jgi:cycloartenol synthase
MAFEASLMSEEGYIHSCFGGPTWLTPGLVIACHVTGVKDEVLSAEHKREMIRYLKNHQNEDGGYGIHIEGASTMIGTGLRYASATFAFHECFSECPVC